MIHMGIDLGKFTASVALVDDAGQVQQRVKLSNDGQHWVDFLTTVPRPVQAVFEACGTWPWVAELLETHGIPYVMAHPWKVKAIASARIKTDAIDARTLGELLRLDAIPPAYAASAGLRARRARLRARAALVHTQTSLKNRVHALLAQHNVRPPASDLFGARGRRWLQAVSLPSVSRSVTDSYLRVLEGLRTELAQVTRAIRAEAEQDPEARRLMSVPGIGALTAWTILAEIGDLSRFATADRLCSYAGLVPSTHQTGTVAYHGHITRQGSRWLRWALVSAALHAVGPPGPLRRFSQRIMRKKGASIARVAAARKLLSWLFYMLRDGVDYPTFLHQAEETRHVRQRVRSVSGMACSSRPTS